MASQATNRWREEKSVPKRAGITGETRITASTTVSCRHARGATQARSLIRASAAGPQKSSTLTVLTTASTSRKGIRSSERPPTPRSALQGNQTARGTPQGLASDALDLLIVERFCEVVEGPEPHRGLDS